MNRAGESPGSLWERHARQFERMGPPLRPSDQDTHVARRVVRDREDRGEPTRVLILGVTPEYAALGEHTLAADRSAPMIRGVWPRYGTPVDSYACADWTSLPIRDGSRDVVLCDGGLTLRRFPHDYGPWTAEVLRVLSRGGVLILRAFVLPRDPDGVDALLGDLDRGRSGGFHAFRWRLAMALQEDPEVGVCVDDVWRCWDTEIRSRAAASGVPWTSDEVRTIEAYRGVRARLHFPSLEALESVLHPSFRMQERVVPTYELGERCPTLVLSPRGP